MKDNERWEAGVQRRVERMQQAERERPGIVSQTVYLGTLGLVFVLPVIAGAFLGHWLDNRMPGFSIRWTLMLLVGGLMVGGYSAYAMIRRHE